MKISIPRAAAAAFSFLAAAIIQSEAVAQCESSTNVSGSCYFAPGTMNHFGQLGLKLQREKNYKGAVDAYTKAIALSPGSPTLYNNRAQVLEELGERDKAIEDYDKAISLNPRDDVYYLNRGHNFFQMQQYASARSDYEKALSINPKAWLARGRMAELNIALERYEQALDILNGMIAQNPRSFDMRRLRASAYKELEKFDEALADLRCETFDPVQRTYCYPLRADVHLLRGDTGRSSADVNMALRLDAKSDYAYRIRRISSKSSRTISAHCSTTARPSKSTRATSAPCCAAAIS